MVRQFMTFAAFQYVTDIEEEAVQRMYDWEAVFMEGDSQLYYETTITVGERELKLICARQDEMGMTAAATLSMKIIQHFRPKYLIMPGIAAGAGTENADSQMYGDVILANCVWNYSNGKYVSPNAAEIVFGEVGFIPRPSFINTDEDLLPMFEKAIASDKLECHVHLGAMASGSTVVANQNILEKQIRSKYQDTQGLEMEAYGVAYAAHHSTEPRPYFIIAKSICDFADERKSDMYQKFASYTSCEFVKFLVEEILE